MTTLEISLIGLIAVIIGVILDKVWSVGRINALEDKFAHQVNELGDRLTRQVKELREEFKAIHERCHEACRSARIQKEHELETQLKELTSLLRATLKGIESRQKEVFETVKEHKRISANHFSKLDTLIGMLKRNGLFREEDHER